jgi:hypothetical protein
MSLQKIKEAFRGAFLKDLRPIEDREGLRLGEDVRFHMDKEVCIVRFLKGTDEKTRKQYRDKLDLAGVSYKEGKDFTL